ncbi:OB-fold protein [Bradyrhizobium elkanii]|uniref:Zinc-ribbon domain-containing protein n=1 Tax=Bradyrhizobium elkanii TaxID=29448 RepID=A0ABV4FH54_BRAEL|nr:zinc-ribbon domain-containing protein [Bradyrhizobium elkanii]MCP1754393.1 hypothetical protein [Bradyrhizobium elkanii]MCP1979913.1 hypothetical protein [Bradyrhizobium elkanii]MCS3885310.1 hypothetical protein [Bradyrhizobium elkanii]MCS4215664.1 hypothetical protein [Bradyrhizobium elkanii]MCW2188747.1 hypothetical protein [Bradyrhizobium elkanii]
MALITCEECGASISDRAPACPHCGDPRAPHHEPSPPQQPTDAAVALTKGDREMGFGRKILVGFFGAIGLIWLAGSIGGKTASTPSGTSTAQSTPVYKPPPTEILTATAQELFDAYASNEVATDIRLKGKIIQVSGRIQSIDKSVFDTMYVSLETSNQFMPTKVSPNKQDESKVAALRRGQQVVFRCRQMKRWVGSPMGEDCLLLD